MATNISRKVSRTLLDIFRTTQNLNQVNLISRFLSYQTANLHPHHRPTPYLPLPPPRRNLTTNVTLIMMADKQQEDITSTTTTTTTVSETVSIISSASDTAITSTAKNGSAEPAPVSSEAIKDVPDNTLSSPVASLPEKKTYLRRKKMALMLSYCGQTYCGMQKNPGQKTIEDDLLTALLKAGYIDEESVKTPRVIQFQRAARTDKHVSAARQIVSMKLPDEVDIAQINVHLPPEIRIMGAKKVTKGFCCKTRCDGRTYLYMIPTFAFTPVDVSVTEDYRLTPEVLESLRETLKIYLGTKNFFNFTSGRKPTDPSSRRYIMSFTASDPFVKDGLEYVILRVKGQSFMMHQIRKMIGLVIAYMRGFAGKETFSKAWDPVRIDIPKAPGLGLVLDQVHYERYNERYGKDGMHSALIWDDKDEVVDEFCQSYIYPVITKEEMEEKSMFKWLITLPFHTYNEQDQVRTVGVGGDDDVINVQAKEYSGIGKAAWAAVKEGESISGIKDGSDDDEDGKDDDEDSLDGEKKGRKIKKDVSGKREGDDEDGDDDDNAFVAAELAKRRRVH